MTPCDRRRIRKQRERLDALVTDQIKLINRVQELERQASRADLLSRKDSLLGRDTK